jgi:hypothetical protein
MMKSRRMIWAGHVACVGEKRIAYRILVGNPDEKRPLGRPKHRWEDNIKIGLKEIRWGVMVYIHWPRMGTSGGLL